jgi:phosphomannomutase
MRFLRLREVQTHMRGPSETLAIDTLMAESRVGFGTSGARGLATAMTDRVCYAYTVGFLQYLERAGEVHPGDAVAVAGDFRPSSGRIMAACARAVQDLGYRPIHCGRIPTPAVTAYGMGEGIASLMVTGSHIPDDRNGIKFNRPGGEILKDDEAGIREQEISLPADLFDEQGMFVTPEELPPEDRAAYRGYLARYLDFLPPGCLSGARVLLYEHSSVARECLGELLEALGAEVLRRGRSEQFVPVDTEAIRPEDVALARDWAASEQFDMILSADGDGDRPLVGDERGEWLRGDVAGILVARYLDADTVVTPVSSNTALEGSGWFHQVLRTRIGSPYVIAAMQAAAEGGSERVVGYEANGGFLTMSDIRHDDRLLPALPTRDAAIVGLALLLCARECGCRLSELPARLPQRYTASDRLKAFPTELSRPRIEALAEGGAAAIEAAFPGLGAVSVIDQTDGLRVTFANGEIVHLRPSGNAPELRCYNEADSPERAAELNRECLAILAGWQQ